MPALACVREFGYGPGMMSDPAKRPNIVFIVMDDLCWGDLAAHGNPYTRTPNLDAMREQSTRLTRYYSGPLCTPARASVMSGRYAYRTRAIDTYCGRSMMDPEEYTLAEMLRDAGYRTGLFGKWHLGDSYPTRPIDQGFEEVLMHNGGGLRQPANLGDDGYDDPELMHNGQLRKFQGFCTDIFGDATMDFIERHRDEPFFACFATNAPHSPFDVRDEMARHYLELGLPDKLARLYAMVENIDANVGKVLAKLDALGLTDETIVVYTSDHGPCGSASINGEIRYNAELRAGKGSPYDGGLKVPSFWRWPGRFTAGADIDRIAHPVDVMPTFAALCGATLPGDRKIDGANLAPLLTGEIEPGDWPDRVVFHQWHRGDEPVRYRNFTAIAQRYKLVRTHEDHAEELYDVPADPRETTDVAGEHPEVVESMRAAYDAWFDDVSSTRPDNYAPPRIVVGTVHENPVVLNRNDWRIKAGVDQWNQPQHDGFWLITVAAAGGYSLKVRVPPRDEPCVLRLMIGKQTWTAELDAGATAHVFPDAELPAGDTRVDAVTTAGGKTFGAMFVHLEKR